MNADCTVTAGVDFPTYAAIEAVNWSRLRAMANSPAHYLHRLSNPPAETPAMAFGRAVHVAVLEPDRFPLEYVVFDGARRQGKVWDEFAAANADKNILKANEYAQCLAVRDAVRSNPLAAKLLGGHSEVVVEWTDPETALKCKGRLDHIFNDAFIDLKTTSSVDAWAFCAHSARMLYHSQMAFYQRGTGFRVNPSLIAVETDPPYDVAVFTVTDDAMLTGDQQVSDLLLRVAQCQADGQWPGRYSTEQELTLPGWMTYDESDVGGLGITIGGGYM